VQAVPNVKDIVLVGGGHAHGLVIRMWAMDPAPGLRLTLISPDVYTPYSGMLPGLIAGHYEFEQAHIDLPRLCARANVRFIQASANGLNTSEKSILLENRPAISYDVCSLDIGSTPDNSIQGAAEFATGVKPISRFYQHWTQLKEQLKQHKAEAPFKVAIIGGGAGGIELIGAMNHWAQQNDCHAQFHLLSRGNSLLSNFSKLLQRKLLANFKKTNIKLHLNFDTQSISANSVSSKDDSLTFNKIFSCTQASAAAWLKQTKLNLNEHGFVEVNQFLQSSNHENVFAAGDIAHLVKSPRPKAGVYAVRMGPILFNNLINNALDKKLKPFKAQSDFLSLIALGGKTALGSRPPFSIAGSWVWKWKNHIDLKFMNMLQQLPAMPANSKTPKLDPALQKTMGIKDISELAMRCGGCGGKIGASILSNVLSKLNPHEQAGIDVGLKNSDDAAVLDIPAQKKLVQTIDHLKTFISDPYLFGKLSALHALSDAFAMHAKPHSAQALVQLPVASEAIQERDMSQLMQGAISVLNQHQCTLVGGHTSEESQLNLGFCINALASQEDLLHKKGAKIGQVLILTQPLGTGVLFAAHQQGLADGLHVQNALNFMLQSNQKAANIFYQHNASALTDITGFGLVGHLLEILKGTQLGATLSLDKIPTLEGSIALMRSGISSSLQPHNVRLRRGICEDNTLRTHEKYPLLFDPQTCGGLLAAINKEDASAAISALKEAGFTENCIIGGIIEQPDSGLIKLD
jgi:selenide,water dikinase